MSAEDSLPQWLIVAGSITGLVTGAVEIVRFGWFALKKPKLEIRLTREVFFRLSPSGESLFANAVLIARHNTVEVRKVSFQLQRTSGQTKGYKINALDFGEKVANPPNPQAAHSFNSKSSLGFISTESAKHTVYLSVFDEYDVKIRREHQAFREGVLKLQREAKADVEALKNEPDETLQKITDQIDAIIEEAHKNIFDSVQLEPGKFKLTMHVEYRPLSKLWPNKPDTCSSSINFEVEQTFRTTYKDALRRTLLEEGQNILFNRRDTVILPEYEPLNSAEE